MTKGHPKETIFFPQKENKTETFSSLLPSASVFRLGSAAGWMIRPNNHTGSRRAGARRPGTSEFPEAPETNRVFPGHFPNKASGLPICDRRQLATGWCQGRIEDGMELCKWRGHPDQSKRTGCTSAQRCRVG